MIENLHGRNYELAKAEADKVDEQIIEVLQAGHSFRVEAGAGSGKTYSLNKVIEEDPFLLFFMETVEPIYYALNTSDMQLLFDPLGIKRYPITKKAEKNKWKELQRQLDEARKKRAIDVFEIINRTKLIPIPPKLDGWYCFIQDFIDGQAPYLYKHIFSQSELSELLHGSIKSDTESFVSVIVASVWQLFFII